jgi:acylpyruvate hydrolase
MKLLSFLSETGPAIAASAGDDIIDLTLAAPDLPRTMRELLDAGPVALEAVHRSIRSAPRESYRSTEKLKFLPLITNPSKIICLGANFREHAAEGGVDAPDFPPIFMRAPSSLAAHKDPIVRPSVSNNLDFEAELAVVIGEYTHRISLAKALSVVAGYSIFNDGSVRDYQLRTSQWTLGKNFDATGGLGPYLVTPDELPEGGSGLSLQTRLNGVMMQNGNTSEMIFSVADAISMMSECMTLWPGDVIIMGTCGGVGFVRKPPIYLKPGDLCEVEIEGIGILSNPIVQEDPARPPVHRVNVKA